MIKGFGPYIMRRLREFEREDNRKSQTSIVGESLTIPRPSLRRRRDATPSLTRCRDTLTHHRDAMPCSSRRTDMLCVQHFHISH